MSSETLWDLEKNLWTGDARLHESRLSGDALMVLPSVTAFLEQNTVFKSLNRAERWQKVEMSELHVVELSADAAVLVYSATARANSDERSYHALCSSAYVRHGNCWHLALHQQTPLM